MQNQMLVLAVAVVVVAAVQAFTFGPEKAVLVFDEAEVDVCSCCYSEANKTYARGRRVVVRPQNYTWLQKDKRVSIDVLNCVAQNAQAPNYPAVLVNALGQRTAVAQAVKFDLQKKQDGRYNGNPFFIGYVCPFILGPPSQILVVNTTISCDVEYCFDSSEPSLKPQCRVHLEGSLPAAPLNGC